jgi:hypothetical protein
MATLLGIKVNVVASWQKCLRQLERRCGTTNDAYLFAVNTARSRARYTWPSPDTADTELDVLMEPEVGHEEMEVYTRVQARGCAAAQRAGRLVCLGFTRSQLASVTAAQLGEGACG